jgi:hypothetical protein
VIYPVNSSLLDSRSALFKRVQEYSVVFTPHANA